MTKEQFRAIRTELDWTTEEAATKLGVSGGARSVRRWESGQYPVPDTIAICISFYAAIARGELVWSKR